jgi:hypothetical protein
MTEVFSAHLMTKGYDLIQADLTAVMCIMLSHEVAVEGWQDGLTQDEVIQALEGFIK